MPDTIRIGTRESKLALWQATRVSDLLSQHGYKSELVLIKSEGDLNLTTPLYELGVQGIFTKALDIALLENNIDIAVHSYKDIPTQPAKGLRIAAVLKRDNPFDILVSNTDLDSQNAPFTIATSSIRRKAQWLYRYPGSIVENLRGNVNTRLDKLKASHWTGAIFAAAGLERLGLTAKETGPQLLLHWMIPAPAQGAIAIVCRDQDEAIQQSCLPLNNELTQLCTKLERDFLRLLQGGCSTSISGLATVQGNVILFKGNITAPDGSESIDVMIEDSLDRQFTIAQRAADEIMHKGAGKYIQR